MAAFSVQPFMARLGNPVASAPRPVYPQQETIWPRLGRSQVVKGCRIPAVAGCLPQTGSAGVGQTSGEETAGGSRLCGAARVAYGDLMVGRWFLSVMIPALMATVWVVGAAGQML